MSKINVKQSDEKNGHQAAVSLCRIFAIEFFRIPE